VFDHLANQFCVCDRWFSSLPGPTHPTRAYAVAGESAGRKENARVPAGIFNIPTIFDLLPDNVTWRYYSHDIAFLRSFDKYLLDLGPIDKVESFYEAARAGELPNVCWIDPDFGIFYREDANDDHPPADIRRGQNLVSMVYNALLMSGNNQWQKTLFIVLYDEHGGFYDHVDPTQWTPQDDRPEFRRYGVRVPALVISPWVSRRIAYGSQSHHLQSEHVVFDHTSILKTILRRFCVLPSGRIPPLTIRVDTANDLSGLLTEDQPRTDCTPTPAVPYRARATDRMRRFGVEPLAVRQFSDLQQSLRALGDVAIQRGVPPDKL
jgi:phospholipase C